MSTFMWGPLTRRLLGPPKLNLADLLEEALGFEGSLHGRPRGDTLLERQQVRERRQIEVHVLRPTGHCEKVCIRRREPVPDEVSVTRQVPFDQRIAFFQVRNPLLANGSRDLRVEQRAVRLVN